MSREIRRVFLSQMLGASGLLLACGPNALVRSNQAASTPADSAPPPDGAQAIYIRGGEVTRVGFPSPTAAPVRQAGPGATAQPLDTRPAQQPTAAPPTRRPDASPTAVRTEAANQREFQAKLAALQTMIMLVDNVDYQGGGERFFSNLVNKSRLAADFPVTNIAQGQRVGALKIQWFVVGGGYTFGEATLSNFRALYQNGPVPSPADESRQVQEKGGVLIGYAVVDYNVWKPFIINQNGYFEATDITPLGIPFKDTHASSWPRAKTDPQDGSVYLPLELRNNRWEHAVSQGAADLVYPIKKYNVFRSECSPGGITALGCNIIKVP